MKRNLILFVFLAVVVITNAQMFNQINMDFPNFSSMKKSPDTFGFSGNNNMMMGMQNDYQSMNNNKVGMSYLQNSQPTQQTQSAQTFQNFQNSQINQQPMQISQSFQNFHNSQNSQPVVNNPTVQVSQPLQNLPSISQIQKMLNDNKLSELIDLINKVKKSSMACDAKSAYLSDILGKIQIAFNVKSSSNKNLDAEIKNAQAVSEKLKNDNVLFQNQQVQLNIPDLKSQYEKLFAEAKNAEAVFRACNHRKQSEDLANLKKTSTDLEKRATDLIRTKSINENELKKIDSDIRTLQQQLAVLRNNKKIRQSNIASLQNSISITQNDKNSVTNSIAVTQNKINEIIKNCNNLKRIADELIQSTNLLADNIKTAQGDFRELDNKIFSNVEQTKRLQILSVSCQDKIVFNGKILDSIDMNLKNLRESILSTAYVCNNAINFSFVNDNEGELNLKFGLMTLSSYLKKSYNYNLININEIYIKPLSIFSKSYQNRYGFCLANDIKTAGQKDSQSYTFDSDFSCYNTLTSAVSKKGTIRSISQRIIQVAGDDGMIYKLIIGSCSRIQGVGAKILPQVDNKIVWKGALATDGYLLHAAAIL